MKKNFFLLILLLVLVVALLVGGMRIESVDSYYLSHIDDIEPDSETCFLTVLCDKALSSPLLSETVRAELPESGILLDRTELVLREGDSAFSLLSRAARAYRIQLEYSGGENAAYVEGISYLYEFACGETSGWMFFVNGVSAAFSPSAAALSDGDEIVWSYTCNLGRDLGGNV